MSLSRSLVADIATDQDLDAVLDLMLAQAERQQAIDARLRPPASRQDLASALADQLANEDSPPLLIRAADGHVRGYVAPGRWDIPEGDHMRAFYGERNGTAQRLTLPSPADDDAAEVASAMLDRLSERWNELDTERGQFVWPSRDLWFAPQLAARGFHHDSATAYRPRGPLPPSRRAPAAGVQIRLARPEDQDALIQLHREELEYHIPLSPFLSLAPGMLQGFQNKLSALWAGAEGAPILVVAEHDGQLVAFAENYVYPAPFSPFFPLGRYGYINGVGVREDWRGRGVGRLLTQFTLDALAAEGIDAYFLFYVIDNPLSSQFWPRMGFEPLVTGFQRMND